VVALVLLAIAAGVLGGIVGTGSSLVLLPVLVAGAVGMVVSPV
jgi:hypothetical protein